MATLLRDASATAVPGLRTSGAAICPPFPRRRGVEPVLPRRRVLRSRGLLPRRAGTGRIARPVLDRTPARRLRRRRAARGIELPRRPRPRREPARMGLVHRAHPALLPGDGG